MEGKYRVREVRQMAGISDNTLNYCVTHKLVKPERYPSRYIYSDADIEKLKFIKKLKPRYMSPTSIRLMLNIKDILDSANSDTEAVNKIKQILSEL